MIYGDFNTVYYFLNDLSPDKIYEKPIIGGLIKANEVENFDLY